MSPELVTVLHSNNVIPQRRTWNCHPTAFRIPYLFCILQLVKWREKKKKKAQQVNFLLFFSLMQLENKAGWIHGESTGAEPSRALSQPGRSHRAFLEWLSLCPTLHPPGRGTPLVLGVLPMGWFPGEGGKQGEGCGKNLLPSGTRQSHRARAEGLGQTFGTRGSCHLTDPTNY